eukprot:1168543-Amphidinium_carterae.1
MADVGVAVGVCSTKQGRRLNPLEGTSRRCRRDPLTRRPRKAVSGRHETEEYLVADGYEALTWERYDCDELHQDQFMGCEHEASDSSYRSWDWSTDSTS